MKIVIRDLLCIVLCLLTNCSLSDVDKTIKRTTEDQKRVV